MLNTTLLVLLSETGLRASECASLKLEDLKFSDDPHQAFIKVRFGKGGKSRLVPFSRKAQESVREYLQRRPELDDGSTLLFWVRYYYGQHSPITRDHIARRLQAISQKTGIPFSAHSLRHYRITEWANNARIPITVTQRWAGHASLEITQRYIHIRDEDALRAAFE